MNITLLGYMTSGKTSIGKLIQKELNYTWIDLDLEIEKKEKLEINKIFEIKGEIYFRKIEREVLLEFLNKNNNIISLGGGTPCYYNNIDEINEFSTSFYLNTSIFELVNRIKLFKNNRPLVKTKTEEELTEYVAKHLFERIPFYNKANHIIKTDNKSFEEIANEIINIIKY
ncbi:MAG: shikimate kinase [Solirubrobacteraceae bacterium]